MNASKQKRANSARKRSAYKLANKANNIDRNGLPNPIPVIKRNTTSIQNNVGKTADGINTNYAVSRINPFGTDRALPLPDIGSAKRLVFNHRAVTDFQVNGTVSICIIPSIPWGAIAKPDTATAGVLIINGVAVTQPTSSATSRNWIQLARFNDLTPTSNPLMDPRILTPPPISNKYRITSVGWRLVCTSPALSIGGVIEVVDCEQTIYDPNPNNLAITTQTQNDVAGTTFAANTITVQEHNFSAVDRYQATTDKTVQLRPEMNPTGVLKHSGPYLWKTIDEYPIMPLTAEGAPLFVDFAPVFFATYFGWDSGFNVARLRIYGANVSYRLEVITTIEYVINPNSPFSRVIGPQITVDEAALALADLSVSQVPNAIPEATLPLLTRSIIRQAKKHYTKH